LDYRNNYVKRLNIDKAAKSFNVLATNLNVLLNYFEVQTKLISNLYSAKFLDTSAKPFFPFTYRNIVFR